MILIIDMKYLVLNEHGYKFTDKKPKGYITLTDKILKKYEIS